MATIDEHKQLTENIKTKLQQFLTIDLVNLTREVELGNQLSFKKGEAIFIKTIDLFKYTNKKDSNQKTPHLSAWGKTKREFGQNPPFAN
jgi:hypothetical protein